MGKVRKIIEFSYMASLYWMLFIVSWFIISFAYCAYMLCQG